MILSGSILVIWFEILLILHGKVIIRLKIRYTDKGRVDKAVLQWCSEWSWSEFHISPAEYLLPDWKRHYQGASYAILGPSSEMLPNEIVARDCS